MMAKAITDLQVGDSVVREMGGVAMPLRVSNVTPTEIHCGAWVFSRKNGAEIDPNLGWDENATGSYIRPAFGRSATVEG